MPAFALQTFPLLKPKPCMQLSLRASTGEIVGFALALEPGEDETFAWHYFTSFCFEKGRVHQEHGWITPDTGAKRVHCGPKVVTVG